MVTISKNFINFICYIKFYPNKSITFYARKLNVTNSYISKICKKLEKCNIIKFEKKDKRSKKIILTDDGEKFAVCCGDFKTTFSKYILQNIDNDKSPKTQHLNIQE